MYFSEDVESYEELCNFLHGKTTLTVRYGRGGLHYVTGVNTLESMLNDFAEHGYILAITDSDDNIFRLGAIEVLEKILKTMLADKRDILFKD